MSRSRFRPLMLGLLCGIAAGAPERFGFAQDTQVYFGNQAIVSNATPSVLFVFDSSGSMQFSDGGPVSRFERLQDAFASMLDNVTNVKVGLARFTVPGGAILFPVAHIDDDASKVENPLAADVTARGAGPEDDAEELLAGGAPLPNRTDSLQLELGATAAFGEEFATVRQVSGPDDDAWYSYDFTNGDLTSIHGGRQSSRANSIALMTDGAGRQAFAGFRFQDLPANTKRANQAAFVQHAALSFTAADASSGPVSYRIQAQEAADARPFADAAQVATFDQIATNCPSDSNTGDVICRFYTAFLGSGPRVEWRSPPEVLPQDRLVSPNVASLLQHTFDRTDWMAANSSDTDSLNNDVAFIFSSDDVVQPDSSSRSVFAADAGLGSSPVLEFEYVAPGAPAGDQRTGLRFPEVQVPQGTRIQSAYIEFVSRHDTSAPLTLQIQGELASNAAPFSGVDGDLASRAKTANDVAWALDSSEVWGAGDVVQSADITAVVQEIVDQGSWCGGNAMVLFFERAASSLSGTRTVYSFDSNRGNAPVLRINFAEEQAYAGGEGCVTESFVRQVSASRDDAEENRGRGRNNGSMTLAGSALGLDRQLAGVRFTNLPIPQSAQVLSAQLELRTLESTPKDTYSLTVAGHLTANAGDFQAVNDNISSRTVTSTVSGSTPPADAPEFTFIPTFDISAVLQEIVTNTSWTSGNDMVLTIAGSGGPGFSTFDSNPSAGAKLKGKIRFNLGDLSRADQTPSITVRDRLKQIVQDIKPVGLTPIVGTLLEAAKYYRGEKVHFGRDRGINTNSFSNRAKLRTSHPATWRDGTVDGRVGACREDNLETTDCSDEEIVGNATYISPITNSCEANYIVFLSDGAATRNEARPLVREMTGVTDCQSVREDGVTAISEHEQCGRELVEFLANEDQSSAANGINTISTYTIGLSLDLNASNNGEEFLQALAKLGNGKYSAASSAGELADKFRAILDEISVQATSFAAPTLSINVFNRLFHRNEVFFSLFEPSKSVRWSGNVKKYNLRESCIGLGDDCEVGEILDVQGNPAIGANQQISDDARSNWPVAATVNDGAAVLVGGAGQVEQTPIDDNNPDLLRRVLVYYDTQEPAIFPEESKPTLVEFKSTESLGVLDDIPPFSAGGGSVDEQKLEATRQFLGWTGPSVDELLAMTDAGERTTALDELRNALDRHIRWIRGEDVDDEDSDPATKRRFSFADPLHSSPIAVTYGAQEGQDPSTCEDELGGFAEECVVVKVFVGTNDGGLKMLNGYDGKEEWVFYPTSMVAQLKTLRDNPRAEHLYGMDGTPTVWVIDRSDSNGDGIPENSSDGIIDPSIGDRVRVFIGQRRGGRMYFGLDVTPDGVITNVRDNTSTTPEYLWRIAGGAGEYPNLGETWSRPLLAKVSKGADATTAISKTVLMVGGGYEASTQDGAFGPGNTGNAIYALDPIDGRREFYVSGNLGVTVNPHGTNVDGVDTAQMQFPIPSDLALMDSDGDGAVDRIYVGDTGGQMWRVDLDASLDDGSDDGTVGGYDITVGRLAAVSFLKSEQDVRKVTPALKNQRKFLYPPDVVAVRAGANASAIGTYDLVTAATGDRASPLDLDVQNRFYAFADVNIARMPDALGDGEADRLGASDSTATFQGPIDGADDDVPESGNMFDVTNDIDPTLSGNTDKVDGSYYITFSQPGEKALAAPIILAGKVFFTTYLPAAVVDSQTCSLAEGNGLLYGLDVLDGSATFNWESLEGTTPTLGDRTQTLGAGIPSAAIPVFQPEKVTLLIGTGGSATTVDPGVVLPRARTYWFEQR